MDPNKDLTPTQEMGGEDGDCTQSQGNVTGENQAEQPNLNDPTPETSGTNQVADDNQRDQSNGATEQSAGTNSSLSAQEDNSLVIESHLRPAITYFTYSPMSSLLFVL